jgi:hypothetical protein
MASFHAKNVGLLLALAAEGFIPVAQGRVAHPTYKGQAAKRAFQRGWNVALSAAREGSTFDPREAFSKSAAA